MLIIPAIDLHQGQCVRLQQGQFDRVSVFAVTPLELVEKYVEQGATHLHMVDLDGAKSGEMQHLELIKSMQGCNISIQAGGGIRSLSSAKACLSCGVKTLVIGSIAISQPDLTLQLITDVGAEKVILALDVNIEKGIPKPAIHGWQTTTDTNLWDVIRFYQDAGITAVLCTDIAQDGMMSGPNFNLYEDAVGRFPNMAWQASGGIRHIDDIQRLADVGVAAVILGRMLYETDFNLATCIKEFAAC